MPRLILKSFQSPGDIVMLSAAVRDLHAAYPGRYQTDVRTSAPAIWEHNPHLTPLREDEPGVSSLDMHYPLIHQSNQRPYHFLHGYVQYLEQQLDARIPVTAFQGDIHLSAEEKQLPPPGREQGVPDRFWIVVAGGKYDFTAKWWNPASFQAVVDHFRERITFVQCGETGHWHPRLEHVVDLVGRTTLREFIRLMHHAQGVLCPVTLAMHLAAAVETKPGLPRVRPCVVVAGGREPAHWEAYPNHQFLSTNGALPCCAHGGCWRSRCQLVGDGDPKDAREVCERPVQVSEQLRIPQCLTLITPRDVMRRIEWYYEGGVLSHGNGQPVAVGQVEPDRRASESYYQGGVLGRGNGQPAKAPRAPTSEVVQPQEAPRECRPDRRQVLLTFRHGLGDAVQLTIVLRHLARLHPDWSVDVAALTGKESAFRGLCRRVLVLERDVVDPQAYDRVHALDWHESRQADGGCPSTKPTRCLREEFGIEPCVEDCRYQLQVRPEVLARARAYLAEICRAEAAADGRFPAVLLHYEGNTSGDRKNLTHELAAELCDTIRASGGTPVILDWDRRSPLPDGRHIFNPDAEHALWGGRGTGDAETLAALCTAARLVIGVDSGPLHVAGATSTPTLGVWTQHHPVHYFDLADNILHVVPGNHEQLVHGPEALLFFGEHYRHQVYKELTVELPALVESLLTGADFERLANRRFLRRLTARTYDRRYYEEHKLAGLDYLGFGAWQQQYGRWFVESLGLRGQRVLDVGCACGSILRGLGQAGAIVRGVDLNEHMVRAGREKWPDMAHLLAVCDAVNLHLYEDACWDAIHTAQVAEHWKPELVPYILRELARVVVPGGLLFCALDTEELFARQGRRVADEDPTHVCVRPLAWWHEQLRGAGWTLCSARFEPALRSHRESFLARYDWDWFVAERDGSGLAGEPAGLPSPAAVRAP